MEESDIGPCPFNIGDTVEISGWLPSFRGKTFEVSRTKVYKGAEGLIWGVCPTERDELRLMESWPADILGDARESGWDGMWWYTGFLKFHSTRNLENE